MLPTETKTWLHTKWSQFCELVVKWLSIMVKKSLEDILRMKFQSAQSGIPSVVYIVVEQEMLGLLRKDFIGETLDAFITKGFLHWCSSKWVVEEVANFQFVYGAYWNFCKA